MDFEWKIQLPFHERASNWPSKLESSRFSAKETPLLDWFLIFENNIGDPYHPSETISIRLSPATKEREKAYAGVTDVYVTMGIIHISNKNVLCSEGSNKNCFSIDFGELQYWIYSGDTVDTLIAFCEINQHHKETLAGNSLGTRAPAVWNHFLAAINYSAINWKHFMK